MHCPRCRHEQPDEALECAACGVIFAQYRPRPLRPLPEDAPPGSRWRQGLLWLRERMFGIEPGSNRLVVGGRAALLLILALWSVSLLRVPLEGDPDSGSFLHLINLPFHEAGHFVFSPFPRFIHVLGGTLGQLLVPLVVLGAFLARRDPFGGAVGGWWLGQSFLDCVPYIADARAGQLPLLGGVTGSEMPDYHDWEVMLKALGWLRHDHAIARGFWLTGALLMALALAWGGWVLWRQWRTAET